MGNTRRFILSRIDRQPLTRAMLGAWLKKNHINPEDIQCEPLSQHLEKNDPEMDTAYLITVNNKQTVSLDRLATIFSYNSHGMSVDIHPYPYQFTHFFPLSEQLFTCGVFVLGAALFTLEHLHCLSTATAWGQAVYIGLGALIPIMLLIFCQREWHAAKKHPFSLHGACFFVATSVWLLSTFMLIFPGVFATAGFSAPLYVFSFAIITVSKLAAFLHLTCHRHTLKDTAFLLLRTHLSRTAQLPMASTIPALTTTPITAYTKPTHIKEKQYLLLKPGHCLPALPCQPRILGTIPNRITSTQRTRMPPMYIEQPVLVDESVRSGESCPVKKRPGSTLPNGAKNVSNKDILLQIPPLSHWTPLPALPAPTHMTEMKVDNPSVQRWFRIFISTHCLFLLLSVITCLCVMGVSTQSTVWALVFFISTLMPTRIGTLFLTYHFCVEKTAGILEKKYGMHLHKKTFLSHTLNQSDVLFAFDKTGTLTTPPEVMQCDYIPTQHHESRPPLTQSQFQRIVLCAEHYYAEKNNVHAMAVVNHLHQTTPLSSGDETEMTYTPITLEHKTGSRTRGIHGIVTTSTHTRYSVYIGNRSFIQDFAGIDPCDPTSPLPTPPEISHQTSCSYVVIKPPQSQQYALYGRIYFMDKLVPSCSPFMRYLHRMLQQGGIPYRSVIISGAEKKPIRLTENQIFSQVPEIKPHFLEGVSLEGMNPNTKKKWASKRDILRYLLSLPALSHTGTVIAMGDGNNDASMQAPLTPSCKNFLINMRPRSALWGDITASVSNNGFRDIAVLLTLMPKIRYMQQIILIILWLTYVLTLLQTSGVLYFILCYTPLRYIAPHALVTFLHSPTLFTLVNQVAAHALLLLAIGGITVAARYIVRHTVHKVQKQFDTQLPLSSPCSPKTSQMLLPPTSPSIQTQQNIATPHQNTHNGMTSTDQARSKATKPDGKTQYYV